MTELNGRWLEKADTEVHVEPYEAYKGLDGLSDYVDSAGVSKQTAENIQKVILDAPNWLSAAAEKYHMSTSLSDYFVISTIIMPSDLPNRNGTAFPYRELTDFNPTIGNLAYRGWVGKPIYVEHNNLDFTKSMGAVVDVSMRPIQNTQPILHKVLALMAIDRTKNPVISNAILNGRRPNYSMGALVKQYRCSVCGATTSIRKGAKSRTDGLSCGDQHVGRDRNGGFKTFNVAGGGTTIGYLKAEDILPFEISSVSVPAFASADSRGIATKDL